MRRAKVVLVAAMAIPLAGCILSGKPKTVAAAAAPPKPTAPAPAPEPLSIPQTQVELPAAQKLDPDALNTEPPEEPARQAPPKPVAPANKPPRTASPQPKPADTAPPVPEPAPENTTEPAREPIHEIMPDAETNRLRDQAHAHQAEAEELLRETKPRTANQRRARDEINQFVQQSKDAEKTGNMRLADEFASRALILAKELQSGK